MIQPTKEELSAAFEWLRELALSSSIGSRHAKNALHEWHRLAHQYEPKEKSDGTRLVLQSHGGNKGDAVAHALMAMGSVVRNPDAPSYANGGSCGSAEARWV